MRGAPPFAATATARLIVSLGLALGASGAGCGGSGGDGVGAADDGARRGVLAVYVADGPGGSQTTYFLRDPSGHEQKLIFDDGAPAVPPNATVAVWGDDAEDGFHVTSYQQADEPSGQVRSELIGATPFAPRSFAFVLIDLGQGVNTTADQVNAIMQTNADSIRNHFLGDSYQVQDITTTVFGPISYTLPSCSNSDTMALSTTLRPMVNSMAGGATFDHYLWYFGSNYSACAWTGLASVGTAQNPSRDTWYNASTNCVVLVQEPGHNFGMQHSSSLACPGASFADDPNGCTSSEYGDLFDPMGDGCRQMNAWQKSYQGWFGGCNGVRVTNTGTFNLVPFELSCSGVQFLQIAAPKARSFMRPAGGGGPATTENLAYYYVELRTGNDFDGTLGNRTAMSPTVMVHVADDLHDRSERGVHTFLLDMSPSSTVTRTTFNDAGLAVGQTFTDPAGGLTITTQSLSATGATISVTYTAGGSDPVCLDGTPFAAPGPGIESCSSQGDASGAAGTSGTGVASGTAGTTGTGGSGGQGGGTTVAGHGGASGTGASTNATTGAAGVNGVVPAGPGTVQGGCGCAAEGPGSAGLPWTPSALGLLWWAAARRRARPRS